MIIINAHDYFMHSKRENVMYIDVSSSCISAAFRKTLRLREKRDSYESDNRIGSICPSQSRAGLLRSSFFLAEFN